MFSRSSYDRILSVDVDIRIERVVYALKFTIRGIDYIYFPLDIFPFLNKDVSVVPSYATYSVCPYLH